MTMIWRRALAGTPLVLLLALTLTACGLDGSSAVERPTPPPGAIVVEMDEMSFSPDEIRVPAGEPVTIALTNVGGVKHDFSIDALDIEQSLDAGKSSLVTFDAPAEPGEYEIYCRIPGHEDSGMTGMLIVE